MKNKVVTKNKVITFLVVYFPIVLNYLVLYSFWYFSQHSNESDLVKNKIYWDYHDIVSKSSGAFTCDIPILIVFLVISLLMPSAVFFKSRQKHFCIAFLWWVLFFVFDPVFRWFMD